MEAGWLSRVQGHEEHRGFGARLLEGTYWEV